jgi:hypothetical protein
MSARVLNVAETDLFRALLEQGVWADGCSLLTCGATTGHFVRPIAFCDCPETATALAATLARSREEGQS